MPIILELRLHQLRQSQRARLMFKPLMPLRANKKTAFLHPALASVADDDKKIDMDYFNNVNHDKKNYKPCAAPWGTAHINVDGTFFPCLAVNMGNVKDGLDKVIFGEKFKKFKETIEKEGTVEACNRCGWLKPLN